VSLRCPMSRELGLVVVMSNEDVSAYRDDGERGLQPGDVDAVGAWAKVLDRGRGGAVAQAHHLGLDEPSQSRL
jgi:hypothetical protein